MDNQNKVKRLGIALCILGAVLFLFGGYLIVSSNLSKGNKKEIDNAQATSEASITENDTSTEDGEEQIVSEVVNTEDVIVEDERNLEATQSSEQTKEEKKSAHEINPDVYEWPCGKESFQDMEEPEDVLYFAKNKDLFDAIVEEFSRYKGKDVDYVFAISDGMFWESDDGNVSIKEYNKKYTKQLLEDEYINFVTVYDRGITFGIKENDLNDIIYSFNNDISPYNKVNIAPHWWWKMGVGD
ncbi:MAG: hypothetical protein J6D02_06340 [Lachnospira sp.]|nr:hypothetical protein [Lachnospira sp.]